MKHIGLTFLNGFIIAESAFIAQLQLVISCIVSPLAEVSAIAAVMLVEIDAWNALAVAWPRLARLSTRSKVAEGKHRRERDRNGDTGRLRGKTVSG